MYRRTSAVRVELTPQVSSNKKTKKVKHRPCEAGALISSFSAWALSTLPPAWPSCRRVPWPSSSFPHPCGGNDKRAESERAESERASTSFLGAGVTMTRYLFMTSLSFSLARKRVSFLISLSAPLNSFLYLCRSLCSSFCSLVWPCFFPKSKLQKRTNRTGLKYLACALLWSPFFYVDVHLHNLGREQLQRDRLLLIEHQTAASERSGAEDLQDRRSKLLQRNSRTCAHQVTQHDRIWKNLYV